MTSPLVPLPASISPASASPALPARITMPEQAAKGDIIEIRVLARHPMERGIEARGLTSVPRMIINTLKVSDGTDEIFRMDLSPGISANPYVSFTTVALRTTTLTFEWVEDSGKVFSRTATLTVA